jgi:hypothetical protein
MAGSISFQGSSWRFYFVNASLRLKIAVLLIEIVEEDRGWCGQFRRRRGIP